MGREPGLRRSLASQLYERVLLGLYPAAYRREYGEAMAQLFRDLYRDARREQPLWGPLRLWARVLVDTGVTAPAEHAAAIRSSLMKTSDGLNTTPQNVMVFLMAAVVAALGILASVTVRELGGSPAAGAAVAAGANLVAAVMVDAAIRGRGLVVLGMLLYLGGALLPTLWVPDAAEWLSENPTTTGFIVVLASWTLRSHARWAVLLVAGLLGAAYLLVSLF